jgi:aldehyde:ferredoxin oxidoreductase
MAFGSTNQILRVDLTSGDLTIETLEENFYRQYPGAKALAGYYLLKENKAGVDPLGPDNTLVLASGVITGGPLGVATRFTAAARSPLTGGYGETEAGGYWGPELKFAGFEAILIKGKSPKPVYLWIKDGQAEIRSAEHLWGRAPHEVQETIRAQENDQRVRVLQIGEGGENLVRYACLTNELRHFNGRTGMGAVMGSKNLKAVAVRGSGRYDDLAFDPARLKTVGRALAKSSREHPLAFAMHDKGTPGVVDPLNAAGILPTRNFRQGAFDGIAGIGYEAFSSQVLIGHHTCYACPIACKQTVEVNDRYQVSSTYGGPEYETIGSFGSVCGVDDIQAVAKANELCNTYTLDTISTGVTIAFAMECFEKGLIGLEDTGGIDLRFGNADAMLQMIDLIAHRKGFGDLLAEGSLRAAQKIGNGALQFAMQVKGQELPMHDPRGKVGVGLGYAISDTGADHVTAVHDTAITSEDAIAFKGARDLGIKEAIPARELSPRKAAQYALFENWVSFGKVAGFCYFGPVPRCFVQVDEVLEVMQAATGWDFTLEEALRTGERATNLARIFNVREGLRRADDTLPERLFGPLENGTLEGEKIDRQDFEQTMTYLYKEKGWDPETAAPTRDCLMQLGLEWAADLIGAD